MGIIDGIVGGYMAGKQRIKAEAYAHLQSMSDQIGVMQRVCQASTCSNCRYGTSPTACEYNALIELYNETLDDYAQRRLVKKE